MPRYREALDRIQSYDPGKPIDEVSRELGISDIVKMASNESPYPPFPEVQEAIAVGIADVNRYPENNGYYLVRALADMHGLDPGQIWVGGGSTELLTCIGLAVGGTETSAVFPWPSFAMYPIITALSGAEPVRVPLDESMRLDAAALLDAVRPDTTLLYVCNPNNPTGTHLAKNAVDQIVDHVPEDVLVVIDEAYHHFVSAPDYASALAHAMARPNVVVTRTFSKVYGLAGMRVGYMVGDPTTLAQLRKTQVPFSVNSLAQAAATEALRHQDRVAQRVAANAAGRSQLLAGLAARNVPHADSQTNFILVTAAAPKETADRMLHHGVIVRPMGDSFLRVTVGTEAENERFFEAWDEVAGGLQT